MNGGRMVAILSVLSLLFSMGTSGCVKRTKVVTKPREDQALTGNRGYLAGTPPPAVARNEMRTYYETEIEVPTIEMHIQLPQWRREWVDKELYGNRGYLVGGPAQEAARPSPAPAPVTPPRKSSFFQRRPTPIVPEEEPPAEPHVTYDTYTVQKGETLGEIAARPEIYGSARAWSQIYEANRDILTDPNRIKPGQVLRIPRGAEPRKAPKSGTIK